MVVAWFSPWAVGAELEQQLARCGWSRCTDDPDDPDDLPDRAVVLYAPPDQLLAHGDGQLDVGELLAGYRPLLGCSQRLISSWRLQACSEEQLRRGLPEGLEVPAPWPQPEALTALITRQLLDGTPGLLDVYLDLELKADLLGGEPDVHDRKRLLADLDPEALLAAWREPLALREQLSAAQEELSEAREEAELTLLQLHEVQEELAHYFLKQREQSTELEALQQRQGELQSHCDQLQTQVQEREQSFEQQLSESQQQLTSAQEELSEAREEAELTLLQLHEVQEELDHYFLLSRSQASQLERYEQLLRRGEGLLSRAFSPQPVG